MEQGNKREQLIRKSALTAEGRYEYMKLTDPRPQFLSCEFTEQKEDIRIVYDIERLKPYAEIRKEPEELRLVALIDALHLGGAADELKFSLDPDNLYYDRNHRIYVMERDLYSKEETDQGSQRFLAMVKALAGSTLWKKYKYSDYINGGMDLLKKKKFLRPVYGAETKEELEAWLFSAYDGIVEEKRQKKIEVSKGSHYRRKWYAVLCTVLLLAVSAALGYLYIGERPLKQALIDASGAYLEMDYIKVIDTLADVDIDRLEQPQKYILAVSYIRGESLSADQKDNILSSMTLRGEDKLKDYWIHLGRLNVVEAQNIAMQRSDDELLLYAYMKEKSLLEANTEISGEEKSQMLSNLDGKIEPLQKKYATEEE